MYYDAEGQEIPLLLGKTTTTSEQTVLLDRLRRLTEEYENVDLFASREGDLPCNEEGRSAEPSGPLFDRPMPEHQRFKKVPQSGWEPFPNKEVRLLDPFFLI